MIDLVKNIIVIEFAVLFSCATWGCSDSVFRTSDLSGNPPVTQIQEATSKNEPELNLLQIKSFESQLEAYSLITASNLFHSDRSFTQPDADESKEKEPTPALKPVSIESDSFTLVGTISSDQQDPYAFMIDKKDATRKGKIQRVRVGDKIGNCTVEEIQSDRVIIRTEEKIAIILLKAGNRSSGPANAKEKRTHAPEGSDVQAKKKAATNARPAFESGNSAAEKGDLKVNGEPQLDPNQNALSDDQQLNAPSSGVSASVCGSKGSIAPFQPEMCGR